MENASSLVNRCPHRTCVRPRRPNGPDGGDDDGGETARCEFIGNISGIDDASLLKVRRDACEVCVTLAESTVRRLNAVHASLLWSLGDRVAKLGGVEGCDVGKAAGIQAWAERYLRFDDGVRTIEFDELDRIGIAAECIHFGERVEAQPEHSPADPVLPQYRCHHPDRSTTTVANCFTCRDWADNPGTVPELREIFRSAPVRKTSKVQRWAVGVTTAPRYEPTLRYCLDSLIRAGWDEPRIFADSHAELAPRHESLPLSLREPKLGAWPNYYLSLVELLMREPHADAFMLVQDDAIFHDRDNLREYLEEDVLWPSDRTGAVSLYSSRSYTQPTTGWFELERAWVWGAVAFIFPRDAAKSLVSDSAVFGHRWSERNDGCANIDVVIGEWAKRHELKIYHSTPSLAQHIGDSSTLWPTARARGCRRADSFSGDRARGAGE